MKKIRNIRFRALTLAFACIIGTSACSSAQTDVSSEVLSTESSSQTENTLSDANSSNFADSTTIYGKVTAVNGNEITFEVGTLNAADALSGATANAQPAGQAVSGQANRQGNGRPNAQPDEQNDIPPEGETAASQSDLNAETNDNMPPDLLTLTGESRTIVIEDKSILSKKQMAEERGPQGKTEENTQQNSQIAQDSIPAETASLSEIQEGTILEVTYQSDGETLASVTILSDGPANN